MMKLVIAKVDPVPEHYIVYVPFIEYNKAFTIGCGAYLGQEVMDFARSLSFYRCEKLDRRLTFFLN